VRYLAAAGFVLVFAVCVSAQTVDEYIEKLKAAQESIAAAVQDPSRTSEAAARLLELEGLRVTTAGGEVFTVSNRWAAELAREIQAGASETSSRSILAKIRAVTEQAEAFRDDKIVVPDARLAAGEEFGESAPKPEIGDVNLGIRERLRRFAEWLRGQGEKARPRKREPDVATATRGEAVAFSPRVFTVIVLILIAVVVAVIALRVARGRSGKPPAAPRISGLRDSSILEDALKRTPEQWKELAREFFESGDYTQALRSLYLSLLVVLHRRRLISYDMAKTNWEYVWELGKSREEHKPFEVLTSAFDYKWYGREQCAQSEYLKLEKMADSIVQPGAGQASPGIV
jgi:hypothetical protein